MHLADGLHQKIRSPAILFAIERTGGDADHRRASWLGELRRGFQRRPLQAGEGSPAAKTAESPLIQKTSDAPVN